MPETRWQQVDRLSDYEGRRSPNHSYRAISDTIQGMLTGCCLTVQGTHQDLWETVLQIAKSYQTRRYEDDFCPDLFEQ